MNESKSNVPNMYQTIPAVAALNRVPGFEPMKLLRRTRSHKSNEIVLKLALPYKKLWYRLAYPKGRIRLNRLCLTEQMAIYEAQVYLDRSDTEPISSFTARCERNDAEKNDYIKDAQEEAINEALSLAGFGLQFADVEMTKEAERFGSEIPLSAVPKQPQVKPIVNAEEPVEEKLPVETAEETELPVNTDTESRIVAEEIEESLPIAPAEMPAKEEVKQPMETAEPQQDKLNATQRAMQILQGRGNVGSVNSATPTAIRREPANEPVSAKYARNTPVPEILKLMTFEEAQRVVVDVGTCNGKTIQEVADTRPATLKYFQFGGYKGGNNILIAAATIMYNHLESQRMEKAG